MIFFWNEEKNRQLKKTRDICVENVVDAVDRGKILDITENPNYPHQKILVIHYNDYAYLVPYVLKSPETYFLKTIILSRKATKKYLFSLV